MLLLPDPGDSNSVALCWVRGFCIVTHPIHDFDVQPSFANICSQQLAWANGMEVVNTSLLNQHLIFLGMCDFQGKVECGRRTGLLIISHNEI